ncbi:nucleoside deaminase [Salibacteraceae bacterium]|jgi:tRNA(adenine34) deaminase|nr:nucleoside deaminase [Salibacteraceae bacterium]
MIEPYSHEHFMKQALQEAQAAFAEDEVPVGALVVANNRIIARAHNLTERLNDVTAHAEMQAITSAADFMGGKFLDKCRLYVTLEPCVMCAGAIHWARFSEIIFGASDPKKGYTLLEKNVFHPKTKVQHGILEAECSALLKEFFLKKRN